MDINQNEPGATIRTVRTPPPVRPRSRLARVTAAIVRPLDRCAAFVGPALTGIGLGMLLVMAGIAVGSLAAAVT